MTHTDAGALLPCPFCGGAAERSEGKKGDGTPWFYIECAALGCGAIAEPKAWNTRAPPPRCAVQSGDTHRCRFCDLDYPLHEDALGFHHVFHGNRAPCAGHPAPQAPTVAQSSWMPPEVAPDVKRGNEKEFVVAVYRAHSSKVYTFACSYLNASRIQYEECPKDNREGFCAGCDDGCPTTGWFRLTGDDSNESGCYQSLDLRDGDKLLGWQPLPAWAPPVPSAHRGGDR